MHIIKYFPRPYRREHTGTLHLLGPPLRAHPLTRPRPHWPSGRVAVAGLRGGPCCGVLRKFRPFRRAASMQWPLRGQCSVGPGCLSLPNGENVRAVRPRHGGASLAAPGLDTPTPARCLNKSGTAWGWGGLRPPSLLAKTKDSVAGFCCAEKQTKKVGRETVRPGSPPPITAAAKK